MALPVDQYIESIQNLLKQHNNLVITATPGAGKTNRIHPALTSLTPNKIYVLEPRRVAAHSSVHRIASENHWTVGKEIGYEVRFDYKVSSNTQIHFMTEAILAKKISQDPELKDCDIVIIDEFHERSKHTDLAIGLLKEMQMLSRPDLKIVVMSATIDAEQISKYLDNSPILHIPGTIFPIETLYLPKSQILKTDFEFIERVATSTLTASLKSHQNTLVFLPGVREIEKVREVLLNKSELKNYLILPLHGQMRLQDQMDVLKPTQQQKIILATNIAETSLTIDGVDTVVDSGLARNVSINPRTFFQKMETQRISLASAQQRRGRAGRQTPGKCYRLWHPTDELSMNEYEIAEIQKADLSETILFLSSLGVTDFENFSWFESPPKNTLNSSIQFLKSIEAIQIDGKITDLGKQILSWPLEIRFSRLLIEFDQAGLFEKGAWITSLLQEKRSSPQTHSLCESDILAWLENSNSHSHLVEKSVEQLRALKKRQQNPSLIKFSYSGTENEVILKILLRVYSDRICKRRSLDSNSALMVGGRGIQLSSESAVKKSPFFIAIDVMDGLNQAESLCRTASRIEKKWLLELFPDQIEIRSEIIFDSEKKKYYKKSITYFKDLPIEEGQIQNATASEVEKMLPEIVSAELKKNLQNYPDILQWIHRYQFYFKNLPQEIQTKLPAWSDDLFKNCIEQACMGESSTQIVLKKNWSTYFEMQIPYDWQSHFQKAVPENFTTPHGSQKRIEYFADKNPTIEVKIQELYGLSAHPVVLSNLKPIPITLHLLGPNYRPVQITSDIVQFWKNSYFDVRKELKARYPKHNWPENPLTASGLYSRPKKD